MRSIVGENKTFLQQEEFAYPNGGQTRKGAALFPDGTVRRVWAGIADTWFSVPCHARVRGKYVAGFLTCEEDGWYIFNPYNRYKHLFPSYSVKVVTS